jgi:cyclic pyranopterin phosphate synthase
MYGKSMAERLIDTFGRVHTDLRVSVTDRCNFRCAYCMPEEGMEWLERGGILTYEEIERIASILVREAGVKSIRLTGGEPTVRARLPLLVARLAALGVELSMTTNGATLALVANDLRAAGLQRINISIDTLDHERFRELTKRNELDRVLEGIQAAVSAGFDPVKLNVVPMRGINDDEILSFLHFGQENGVIVRFIEFMPLDAQGRWSNDRVVTAKEILEIAASEFDFAPIVRGSSPAERFRFTDGSGEFGVIASVTEPFCEACDRMRLTADGQLRNCLFALGHADLRSLLRAGATDEQVLEAIRGEVKAKWAGHAINQVHFIRPTKSMSQLGG